MSGREPWWKAGVIYQIYPRSFQDTDGDGVGDLVGIERRLPHLAELGVDAVLPPEEQLLRPGSCGRAVPGVELRVVGPDGTPLPPGEPGELQVRSSSTFDGYHGREREGEGWKSVGDLGWLDDEGYLHICDRRTDLVITGGMNVYPAEVENCLAA